MSGVGPDMTPQGLSEAIGQLVADLPGRGRKPNDAWQKVLTLQLLNAALANETDADGSDAAWALGVTLQVAIRSVLRRQPALREALATAFAIDGPDTEPDTERTALAASLLGSIIIVSIDAVEKEPTDGAPPTARVTTPGPPPGADPSPPVFAQAPDGQWLWTPEPADDDWRRTR